MSKKILISGLGGGLDIVNASVFYFAAKNNAKNAIIGSVKSAPVNSLDNVRSFADSGAWVNGKTVVNYESGGFGYPRYAEPVISDYIGEEVMYFTENYSGKLDIPRLREAILKAQEKYEIENMIFVDGGGDSLIFVPEDSSTDSQFDDPFGGGDAYSQEALSGIKNVYMAIISVGLDVNEVAFEKNKDLLKERGAYYGRVNLLTGEEDGYKLKDVLDFKGDYKEQYFKLAEKTMVLNEKDLEDKSKKQSHTGVVTYNALKGNFGEQSTFIRFQSSKKEGFNMIDIKPEHCWCYFFDVSVVHNLKVELNR